MTLFPLSAGEPLPFSLPPPSTASAEAGREKDRVYTVNSVQWHIMYNVTHYTIMTHSVLQIISLQFLPLAAFFFLLMASAPSNAAFFSRWGISYPAHTTHSTSSCSHSTQEVRTVNIQLSTLFPLHTYIVSQCTMLQTTTTVRKRKGYPIPACKKQVCSCRHFGHGTQTHFALKKVRVP